jgi:hypothetical protein
MIHRLSSESAELEGDYLFQQFDHIADDERIAWQPTKRSRITFSEEFQESQIVSPDDISRDVVDAPVPDDSDAEVQCLPMSDLLLEEIGVNPSGVTLDSLIARFNGEFDANKNDDSFRSTVDDAVDHLLLSNTVDGETKRRWWRRFVVAPARKSPIRYPNPSVTVTLMETAMYCPTTIPGIRSPEEQKIALYSKHYAPTSQCKNR